MTDSLWTPPRLQLLLDMHAIGLGCANIAQRLGAGISRNQVIEKLSALNVAVKELMVEEDKPVKFRPLRVPHVNNITLAVAGRAKIPRP